MSLISFDYKDNVSILNSIYYVRKCHRKLFISLNFEKLKLLSLKFNYLPLNTRYILMKMSTFIYIYIYIYIYTSFPLYIVYNSVWIVHSFEVYINTV